VLWKKEEKGIGKLGFNGKTDLGLLQRLERHFAFCVLNEDTTHFSKCSDANVNLSIFSFSTHYFQLIFHASHGFVIGCV